MQWRLLVPGDSARVGEPRRRRIHKSLHRTAKRVRIGFGKHPGPAGKSQPVSLVWKRRQIKAHGRGLTNLAGETGCRMVTPETEDVLSPDRAFGANLVNDSPAKSGSAVGLE